MELDASRVDKLLESVMHNDFKPVCFGLCVPCARARLRASVALFVGLEMNSVGDNAGSPSVHRGQEQMERAEACGREQEES